MKSASQPLTIICLMWARCEPTLEDLDCYLTGVGDSLELSYDHSLESSTADWRVLYAWPLIAYDSTIQVWPSGTRLLSLKIASIL